ncbi:MAG: hypothetical protein ACF8NJ_01215 [Phycisphaerales bacterium JB038]
MANSDDTSIGGRFAPTGRERRWPIVFRSLGQALQGARLAVALIAFIILMACGSAWDALSPNRVDPFGRETVANAPEAARWTLPRALEDEDRTKLAEMENLSYADLKAAVIERYRARMDQANLERLEPRDEAHAAQIRQRMRGYEDAAASALQTIRLEEPIGVFRFTTNRLGSIGSDVIAGLWTLNLATAWESVQTAWARLGNLGSTLWHNHTVFSIVFGVLLILLFCFAGGAISRMTALDLSEGRAMRSTEGIGFSLARFRGSLLSLLFFPIVALLLCLLIAVVWGILLRFPALNIIGALGCGLALLLGLIVVLIGVGFLACFSLMVPALAVEQTDGYDAQQRAYAYLLARPGHLVLYTLLALIQGAVALTIIWVVALATLNLTAALAGWIGGDAVQEMAGGWSRLLEDREVWMLSGTQRFAAGLIGIWRAILAALVAAFLISFYFSSQTIIYLLLRWEADGEAIEPTDLAAAAD